VIDIETMRHPGRVGTNPGDPLPRLEGHVSHGRFEQVLRAGHFAVTTEIAPPDSADPTEVLRRASLFDGFVDAVTRAGYSPILQISCRDRNRISIQGDTLGAAALGVCNVLCLTGDDVSAGDHPEAKPVFDLDSISLAKTIRTMRDDSRFLSGRKLDLEPRLFIGSSINPFVPPVINRADQLAKKIESGAEYIQSQYCFDVPVLKEFMAKSRDLGLTEKAYIIIGVGVLPSARTAKWMRDNVPGVHIPDDIIIRLDQAEKPKLEGRKICAEIMQQVKEIEGVSGVHVMAYRQEKWVGNVVKRSGVLDGRKPWAPEKSFADIQAIT